MASRSGVRGSRFGRFGARTAPRVRPHAEGLRPDGTSLGRASPVPFTESNIGLVMPDDFPTSYEVVAVEARNRQWAAVPNQEFGESWNAVPLRFRAVCHHAEQVESSLARFGPGPEPDERWRQELHIFGFFANGLAVLESALYACFALGYLST